MNTNAGESRIEPNRFSKILKDPYYKMSHYPMTEDQRRALDLGIATIMETLSDISDVLRACYDDQDPPVWRAEEARAAMQRLLWALERQVPPEAPETYTPGGVGNAALKGVAEAGA